MMKILHTADWHLGQIFYGHDRTEEQRAMLDRLAAIVAHEQPDALLVSGDVFHTAMPTAAARRLYVDGLLALRAACPTMRIVIAAGNHDSASRLEADRRLWQLADVTVVGGLARLALGAPDPVRHIVELPGKGYIVALPHVYGGNIPAPPELPRDDRFAWLLRLLAEEVARHNTASLPVVLMAHAAIAGSDFTGHDNVGLLDTISVAALGDAWDYVALGHIHRPQSLEGTDGRVRYSGTPLAVSFDEQCEHSVSIVTLDGHTAPTVTTRRIVSPWPLHTIPADPAPLTEAFQVLADFPADRQAYLRLNILATEPLPGNIRDRAAQVAAPKLARLCDIAVTRPEASTAADALPQLTAAQLRTQSPLDVARYHMAAKGTPLTTEQEELIAQVLNDINTEDSL